MQSKCPIVISNIWKLYFCIMAYRGSVRSEIYDSLSLMDHVKIIGIFPNKSYSCSKEIKDA